MDRQNMFCKVKWEYYYNGISVFKVKRVLDRWLCNTVSVLNATGTIAIKYGSDGKFYVFSPQLKIKMVKMVNFMLYIFTTMKTFKWSQVMNGFLDMYLKLKEGIGFVELVDLRLHDNKK